MPAPPASVAQLVPLVQLLLAADPLIGLIRTKVLSVPEGVLQQIEARAERLAVKLPACGAVGTDLRGWAKSAPPLELLSVLRLCLIEGGMMVPGRRRPNDRQSAAQFGAVVLGRGRGVSLPKLRGGRPSDDAEVRLIAHLAVDWLVSTGAQPEAGRDGYSAFSGLVHSVFGWIEIEGKAQHCLRQYWAMVKSKGLSRR
jgi:hypothetical protein